MTWIRWFFILLMAAAGIGKLADMPGFYPIVAGYQLLPSALIVPSAWALTLSELALAGWLLSGLRLPNAALVLIGMHLFYLLGVSQALWRGLALQNCGCFGVFFGRPLSGYTPLEDIFLLTLALVYWNRERIRGVSVINHGLETRRQSDSRDLP